jgi:hypothetical protein
MRKDQALLFNNEWVRHGDVVSSNNQKFMYLIEELSVFRSIFDQNDMTHVSNQSTVNATNFNKVVVFFQKKQQQQIKNEADIKSMKAQVYLSFLGIYLATVFMLSIIIVFQVRQVAKRVTT